MRRAPILFLVAVLATVTVTAQNAPASDNDSAAGAGTLPASRAFSILSPLTSLEVPAARELRQVLAEKQDVPLVSLSVAEVNEVTDLISVAVQQQHHVQKSAFLSRLVPGLGQFVNGGTGAAAGFFAAEMVVQASAAIAWYLLLPASVQVSNLNYLQTPVGDIEDRWKALTVSEMLPSAAVCLSAGILSATIRSLSSRHAADLAVRALEDGVIVFEPSRL